MVKKDLERVGIPYETQEGVADFHAAGRHTYITELLRNGASLPEAKELARHSDVTMTMKYAHIGMEDRARALKRLPTPRQRIGSGNGVVGRHGQARDGAALADGEGANPLQNGTNDAEGQKKAPPVRGVPEWRRRESNTPTCAIFPENSRGRPKPWPIPWPTAADNRGLQRCATCSASARRGRACRRTRAAPSWQSWRPLAAPSRMTPIRDGRLATGRPAPVRGCAFLAAGRRGQRPRKGMHRAGHHPQGHRRR